MGTRLPRITDRTASGPRPPASSRRGRASERRPVVDLRGAPILLVDDHAPNLMALEAMLEPLGQPLVRASSAADAAELAAREDFAVVLLDVQMPELDGLETAALLKKAKGARSVPIIIVTAGELSRAAVARASASGAVDFLSKPLDPDRLRSRVSAFVDLYLQRTRQVTPSEPRLQPEDASGRVSERLLAATPASGHQAVEALEGLMRVHQALTEDLDLPRMAARLVTALAELTGAGGGAFHYAASGAPRLAVAGDLGPMLEAAGRDWAPTAAALAGNLVRIADARAVPHSPSSALRGLLSVPVRAPDGRVAGALVLASARAGAFDARAEELAVIAAHQAATAFENARLYEQATEARHRAELAELELRAGEARLRLALDSAGLGTWDHNPTTGVLRWDDRAKALFGLAPGDDVDYGVFLTGVHREDRRRVHAAIRRALDPMGTGLFDEEYRIVERRSGAERWIAAKGQAIFEQGRTLRFLGTVLDVTTKKRIEQERASLLAREREARAEAEVARARAEAASRAKDEFLATVSHELRNPLNAILGWSRVLLDERDAPDRGRVTKGLEVISRNARAQVQLVEDILEVSRIVTGKLRLAVGAVDVRAAVEAAVETVRSAAQAKGVLLESRFEDVPRAIAADEDRIQQILWNLLSNAVKFTPRGGVVRVTARREADDVTFSVTDTGEGVDPAFLPYVFDRFRQADGTTTRAHGGLGLGLAIVRHLAELHGGTVVADSAGRGRGATFTVRLPVQARLALDEPPPSGPDRARAPASAPLSDVPLAGVRVLVLDDEEDMRELIAMVLEKAGARVTRAATADDALRALEAAPPDLVLSDLAMPGEDGYAFVRRVRASTREEVRAVPMVAMTAYARAEDRHRVLHAGFDRHVPKPIEPAELVSTLEAIVRAAPGARR